MIPKKRTIKTIKKNMSIRQFYKIRNKVLIIRDGGGIGDILMLRMIVEDFKILMPEAEITVAVPPGYCQLLENHPFIDKIENSRELNENEYMLSYNVTNACVRYEMKIAPMSDMHRSDIWAAHCGVKLTKHNMYLSITREYKEYAVKLFDHIGLKKRPIVCFSPSSSTPSKDLDLNQINEIVNGIKALDFEIFILHKDNIEGANCRTINGITLKQWLAIINQSDYVITVDTGTLHAAQGFNKPTVAIFSWADGDTYCKYHENCTIVQRHRKNGDWSCGPCYAWQNCVKCPSHQELRKPCITEITGKEVLEAYKQRHLVYIRQLS